MSVKDRYQVKPIKAFETYDWLLNKHYAKRIPSISYAFGLYDGDLLQGVCTFGKPASPSLCVGICGEENKDYVYELNRLCVDDQTPKNGLSYFVSKSLSMLPKLIIVSYADTQMSHVGYIYQATNWLYTGSTQERTDISNEQGKHQRHYKKGIDYTKNRKFRSSKHRYVYFVGDKKTRKKWLRELNYQVQPYPKGDNQRYDASYTPNTQQTLF
jgi:hypothetical protein